MWNVFPFFLQQQSIHKEDLGKSETEKKLRERIATKAPQQQKRKTDELKKEGGSKPSSSREGGGGGSGGGVCKVRGLFKK